jgi:hypothetical protein
MKPQTLKAMVAHPKTGEPFQPQITLMQDLVTRQIIAFNAKHGRCLVYKSDGGCAQSLPPFNPKSRGVIERLWGDIQQSNFLALA